MPKGINPESGVHRATEKARLRRKELERRMRHAGEAAGERTTGRYVELPAKTIQRPENYQRPFNENAAIEMALIFDWDAFDNVNVTERTDEKGRTIYEYRDGQHRLSAAMLAKGDNVLVPCMVYPSRGNARDAWVFNRINIDRRGLASADKWTSRKAEGDSYVEAVENLLAEFDLTAAPMRGKTKPEPGEVVAVVSLEQMLKKAGEESVRETLRDLHSVFGDNPRAYNEVLMRGVWHFVIRYPYHSASRLRTVLMRNGVEWRPEFSQMDESVAMAYTIWTAYNYKQNPEHRLPPFPMTPRGRQTGHETNRAALEYRRIRGGE